MGETAKVGPSLEDQGLVPAGRREVHRIDIRQPPQVAAVSQSRVFRSPTTWGYPLMSLEILILERSQR